MAANEVTIRVKADDDTHRGLGSAESRVSRLGATVAKAGLAMAAGVGAAVVGIGVGLFKVGESFDSAFDQIRVGTGATGAALDGLKDDFRAVVKEVPASFGDASAAIADLNTRLGITGAPLQKLSGQFLNLSRITGTDVKTNIATLTRLFGDWSIAADKQGAALDGVFRASQATGIGVDKLSDLMVQFGSPLRQLGFDFETTAAMFAQFEKAGVNIQTVLPGLRMGLKNFAQAGRDPAEALQETILAIKDAATTAEANTIAFDVFGARAGADLAAAVREGRFELDDLIDIISNGSDTINQAALDTEDFAEKWTRFKNNVLLALEPIAARVFDGIGAAMDALADSEALDNLQAKFEEFVSWLETDFIPGVKDLGPVIGEQLEGLQDDTENLKNGFSELFEQLGVGTSEGSGSIEGLDSSIVESIGVVAEWILKWVEWQITATTAILKAGQFVMNVMGSAVRFVIDAWDGAFQFFSNAWPNLQSGAGKVAGFFRSALAGAAHTVRSAWDNTWNAFIGGSNRAVNAAGTAARSIQGSMSSAAAAVTSAVRRGAGVTSGGRVTRFAHGGITGAATGGLFSGMRMVGEQGRELVDLAPGSRVHSNPDTERMMGGMGGGSGGWEAVAVRPSGDKLIDALVEALQIHVRRTGGRGPNSVQVALGARS